MEYLDSSTKATDSLGRVTTYTFGVFGDLPLVTQIQGPCACGSPDSTFEYHPQGRRIAQTDARGNRTTFQYDADGNLTQVTDALGQVTTSAYNAFGQVVTTTDPTGATTTFVYDDATGFLRQATNALGHLTTLSPDTHNLPGAVTDPRGTPPRLCTPILASLQASPIPWGRARPSRTIRPAGSSAPPILPEGRCGTPMMRGAASSA